MSRLMHFGIYAEATKCDLPFDRDRLQGTDAVCYGDSFTEWGEPVEEVGGGLHVTLAGGGGNVETERLAVEDARFALATTLGDGYRLADFVVMTNANDWGIDVRVYVDGSPALIPVGREALSIDERT